MKERTGVIAPLQTDSAAVHTSASVAVRQYDYMAVSALAAWLNKTPARVYQLLQQGTLEQAGMLVIRTKRRIWIGVPQ